MDHLNNWDTFSPNAKSDTYFDITEQINDQLADVTKGNNYSNEDQFILNQFEPNLYNNENNPNSNGPVQSTNSNNSNGQLHQHEHQNHHHQHHHHQPQQQNDPIDKINGFSLDNYDFVLDEEDINLQNYDPQSNNSIPINDDHQNNNDYKPNNDLKQQNYHNNSSAFPPSNASNQNTPNMLPNAKHLVNDSNQVLSSPILPSQNDKSFNKQHYYHKLTRNKSKESIEHLPHLQHIRPDVVFTPLVSPHATPLDKAKYAPVQATFEPLTSPALKAQLMNKGHQNGNDKRRSSSSMFSTVDENRPANFKRRTPHGTPIIQTNDTSNIHGSSKSPTTFERLPEASIVNSNSNSSNSTPMLPPQNFKRIDSESTNTSPQMMGFTMGKLAKQQVSSTSLNTKAQDSPILRSRKSSFGSSKSTETSPALRPSSSNEKPSSKKASHKLAEQGRRNRMNSAVQLLGSLIPQSYHDQVSIPSKATTVELGAQYIRDLLKEIERLLQ